MHIVILLSATTGGPDDKRQAHDEKLSVRHLRLVWHLHHQGPRGKVSRGDRLQGLGQQSAGQLLTYFSLRKGIGKNLLSGYYT